MSFSIGGIASGLNTNSIIENLMKIERIPYTRLEAKKTKLTEIQAFYRAFNTKVNTLKDAAADLTLRSNFAQYTANSSNESAIRVSSGNAASTGTFLVEVTQLATPHVLTWDAANPDQKLADDQQKKTLTFRTGDGDKTIDIEVSGTTLGEMMEDIKNKINNNGELKGISASVINTSSGKKLMFTASETGKDGKIEGAKYAGALSEINSIFGAAASKEPDDAIFTVNGVEITKSSNEIKDVIDGVTITLVGKGSSTLNVKTDADKVASAVEKFVKAYNDVVSTIREFTGKEKALQGDSTLLSLDSNLSAWISSVVDLGEDGKHTLAEFGLEVDKGVTSADLMTGKISFDKEKFKTEYLKDPDKMLQMFNKTVKADGETKPLGIGAIIKDGLHQWTKSVDGIITTQIKGYDSEVSYVSDQMERMELQLQKKEERMKKQFVAMEVALSKLKNEQDWMSGQLGMLTKKS
ncbi:Flagellar hook-associated protein 2 [Paenibacillus sp. CECT 9249]|uniref:flagellar filament capping protein FliD n=1 Tax=Paenibacillus sp. CECT 9249 TaxID=2845385 RepID=UPI001E4AB117|nr:flagellar filament capping protein FliD [Paenibacillus sp. CECT 9249]CAH0118013.1 Flagellar hook-associated protein 2 [Paenibacillus sp. CECT 9249]